MHAERSVYPNTLKVEVGMSDKISVMWNRNCLQIRYIYINMTLSAPCSLCVVTSFKVISK